MPDMPKKAWNRTNRCHFLGGSDARIIMGTDEAALLRLWQEKRGEAEPEDLSGNLVSATRYRDRGVSTGFGTSATPARSSSRSSGEWNIR